MLENESLWTVAESVDRTLTARGLDFVIVGGVAVCLHGYRQNTVDLDLLVRHEQSNEIRDALESIGFRRVDAARELRADSGIAIQFVLAGDSDCPGQPARFPDPADANCTTRIEGLPVLSLAALIESKLACGLGNRRRTHKDFADVVELIAIHHLDGSFARKLHTSVRSEFRELVRRIGAEPAG